MLPQRPVKASQAAGSSATSTAGWAPAAAAGWVPAAATAAGLAAATAPGSADAPGAAAAGGFAADGPAAAGAPVGLPLSAAAAPAAGNAAGATAALLAATATGGRVVPRLSTCMRRRPAVGCGAAATQRRRPLKLCAGIARRAHVAGGTRVAVTWPVICQCSTQYAADASRTRLFVLMVGLIGVFKGTFPKAPPGLSMARHASCTCFLGCRLATLACRCRGFTAAGSSSTSQQLKTAVDGRVYDFVRSTSISSTWLSWLVGPGGVRKQEAALWAPHQPLLGPVICKHARPQLQPALWVCAVPCKCRDHAQLQNCTMNGLCW